MSSFKMLLENWETMPSNSKRAVEEFEPYCKWRKDGRDDIVDVYLNGFLKEGLKSDVGKRKVTVSGDRILDKYTKQNFKRTFEVPKNCRNRDDIKLEFTGGILSIKFPDSTKDSNKGAITSITEWCFDEKNWKYVERIGMVVFAACVFKCCLCCSA